VRAVFPTVGEQRCWTRRLVNVLDLPPKKLQAEARELLTKIPYAETRTEAERQKRESQVWATKKGVATAGRRLEEDWERLVTFYAFRKEYWKRLRTTNVVASPFAAARLRTAAAKRLRSSGRRSWSRSRASAGWMQPSACRRSPRAPCTSTGCERSGVTRRRLPDLVYTALDKTSPAGAVSVPARG
jgi:hypothetical protein